LQELAGKSRRTCHPLDRFDAASVESVECFPGLTSRTSSYHENREES